MGLFKRKRTVTQVPAVTPDAPSPIEDGQGKYDMALTEARRSFDEQATQLGRVRGAMTSLLASAGIAFSVLVIAPGHLASPYQGPLLVTAAITFALLAIGVVIGALPIKITPGVRPTDLITWADEGDSVESSTRGLAYHYNEAYTANKKKIDRLAYIHMVCLTLFALTIVILTVRLMGA